MSWEPGKRTTENRREKRTKNWSSSIPAVRSIEIQGEKLAETDWKITASKEKSVEGMSKSGFWLIDIAMKKSLINLKWIFFVDKREEAKNDEEV